MSYTETPEQRQIRILRNSISSMRSDNNRLSSQNRRLEREMELVRRQQQLENERMAVPERTPGSAGGDPAEPCRDAHRSCPAADGDR